MDKPIARQRPDKKGVSTVSRSDQEQRDAQRMARRARRLAERAELRAHRKADTAREAAQRADRLAARAGKGPGSRDFEESLEDYVEHMTERFTRKATDWLDSTHSGFSRADLGLDDDDGYEDSDDYGDGYGSDSDDGLGVDASRRSRSSRAQRRAEHRKRRLQRHAQRVSLWSRFKSGRAFYRDTTRGKVWGVCAGLADYLQFETWQVRLAAVLGLMFVPSIILPSYFILYFVMEDKPYYRAATDRFDEAREVYGSDDAQGQDPGRPRGRKGKLASSTNAQVFRLARGKFAHLEDRVRAIESHVTSSRFELQREFKKIAGDDL